MLKSVLGFLLCQKARGVCQVYCMDQKFVPRKIKIELMSYVCLEEFCYRNFITFRFHKKPTTYKHKKMDWIERERRKNLLGPQRWTSAPASILLNHVIRHRKAFWMRVTVTWSHQWGDAPSRTRNFVPMIWFTDQVYDDIINRREFVFRIWTQTGFTSKHEGFRGLVKVKKEPNIQDENMLLAVDDKPLISSADTPIIPDQLGQESAEKEAKCTEQLITFNEQERRERSNKEIRQSDIDSNQEDGNGNIPNNSQEEAFKEVEQMNPNPPPLPPPLLPIRFKFLSQDIPPGQIVFPSAREPTPFRLKQMVDDMYGRRATDTTDWTKPFTFDSESCANEEDAQPMDASECSTDSRERHTKQIRESDITDTNQEDWKEEEKELTSNSEDREARNTSEEVMEDQTTHRESEGRQAADVGVVRRVTRTLMKVVWVTVTVVTVLVVADALLPELLQD